MAIWENGAGMEAAMPEIWVTYVLIAVLACVCTLPLWAYFRQFSPDLFEPIYWASAYFFLLFIVRPIYDLTLGSAFLPNPPFDDATRSAFNTALLYLIPCFLIFLIGYYSRFGKAVALSLPKIPQAWNARKFSLISPIVLIIGLLSYFLLIRFHGGLLYFISHKQETLTRGGQGYIGLGVSLIRLIFAVAVTRVLVTGRGKILTFLVLLPLVLTMGFISGSKGAFLTPILVLMIAWHYLRRQIRLRTLFLFVGFVIVLFPLFNAYRQLNDISKLAKVVPGISKFVDSEMMVRSVMSRFYGIDSLTYIIRDTPGVMDYQLGATIAPLAVVWIPRQLWPEKPIISFGKVFAETYLRDFFHGTGTAASPTILGEAYINWHIGGMLWISLLCGVIIKTAYEYLIRLHFGAPAIFIYSVLFLSLFIFWESGIAAFIAEKSVLIIVLFVLVALMGQWKFRKK